MREFNTVDKLEECFRKVNCLGEFDYCFTCQQAPSLCEHCIFIMQEDIAKVVIKNDDFVFKLIKIVLKDKTKYVLRTNKKIRGMDYHEQNLKQFISLYE